MRFDIAVIGGGIAGLSAAAALSERTSVVLVEAEPLLGYHATGRSAALYTECYGPGVVPRLTKASRSFFSGQGLASPRGVLFVGTADQATTTAELFELYSATVLDLARLDAGEVAERFPVADTSVIREGILEPGAMDLDVHGIQMAFRTTAMAHGATILLEHAVTAISRSSEWTLLVGDDVITASVIVNAAGAWADLIATMAGIAPLGLTPLKRSAFLCDPGLDARTWPMVIDVDERWYLKPEGTQLLGSAASELPTPPSDARPDEEDVALGIMRIEDATSLSIRSVSSSWAGIRTFTRDRIPVVGFDHHADGFFWLAGQGGYGIKTSPAIARLAAGLIVEGAVPGDLEALGITAEELSPARLGP
ncbi:MAG TPA: FAD-binding oxidoreductase [Acidimicrobiia bacterium]|nr:FAD-binding oxidoreductase [Acidimicrobiia bacterium]